MHLIGARVTKRAAAYFSGSTSTNKGRAVQLLSTFSGTHFVTPRAYQVHLGVTF